MNSISNHANFANFAIANATSKEKNFRLVGLEVNCQRCTRSKTKINVFNEVSRNPPAKDLGDCVNFYLNSINFQFIQV